MEETIDLNGFIQALFERSNEHVKTACDGLSDDQLYYQPTANRIPSAGSPGTSTVSRTKSPQR